MVCLGKVFYFEGIHNGEGGVGEDNPFAVRLCQVEIRVVFVPIDQVAFRTKHHLISVGRNASTRYLPFVEVGGAVRKIPTC